MARTTISWSWAILTTFLPASIAKCAPSVEHVPDSHVKTLSGRQTSNPITSKFTRRALHSLFIVGNHLFIDGGEIAQYMDGELDPWNTRPNNLTLSIDLSSDWTNSTVEIKSIPKGDAPNFTYPGLWPDGDDGFFLWGGGVSGKAIDTSYPEKGLWKFTADSTGNGTWEKVDPGDARVFNGLTRPSYGVLGTSNNIGYYIGGTYSSASYPNIDSNWILPLTGMVTYNWETQTWKNVSSVPYTSPYGTVLSGKMQYVDTFGKQGILVMLGGLQPGIDSRSEYYGQLPLTNLTVYV